MIIREFHPDDAEQISQLFQRSVLELGRIFYTEEQVIAWAARGPKPEKIIARNQGNMSTLVNSDTQGKILAYAELEHDGHIDQVYSLPEAARKNIVSALYDEIETLARNREIKKLYTEASEGALRFFLKKDFTTLDRIDFEIEGVSIHNYNMEKLIS